MKCDATMDDAARTERSANTAGQGDASVLRVIGLKKSYMTPQGRVAVLKGVDLSLDAGASVALMGESGSGKSTLLHLVAGLDDAEDGEIFVDGVEVTGLSDFGRAALRRETLAVVFQQFNLIPSLTIRANVAFQARLAGRFDSVWQEELILRYPPKVGLSDQGKQDEQPIGAPIEGTRHRPDDIPRRD
jgi:putative ABC transport system ATP-binding protein